MKKKILFIMDSLKIGGAEKSLITILNMFDYSKYEVDLYLFSHTGEFYNMIPKEVNVIKQDETYSVFEKNRKKSVIKYLSKLDLKSAFFSMCWLIGVLLSKLTRQRLYIGWLYLKKLIKPLDKKYDVSIAFLERKTIYFNVDNVKSDIKIGFIHNDYSKYPYNYKLDKKYFKSYNNIATVSDNCKDLLTKIFPEYADKFVVIKNMVSKELISSLSKEKIQNYAIEDNYTKIVSVGRLVHQKGFDIAIEICKRLVEDKIDIKWYVVGDGEEKEKLESLVKKYHLENNFYLVGSDVNPYKWISMADIYVQTSRFEGYGITVAEAKMLGKMIVASNIPEFKYQLDGEKGIIANDTEDFCKKIKEIVENSEVAKKYIKNLENEDETKEELEKIIELIEQ